MYVLMITETNRGFSAFTGYNLPELEMTFNAYNSKTDALIWSKEYFVKCEFDWVNNREEARRTVGRLALDWDQRFHVFDKVDFPSRP